MDSRRKRRKERRKRFLMMLGGKCESCGSKKNLHFDHKNPKNKVAPIARMIDSNEADVLNEIKKCRLLCADCHRKKTTEKWDYALPPSDHGSIWHYKNFGCRCDKCKKAMSEYYYSKK